MTYSLSTDYYAECERVSGLLVDFDGETRFPTISEHVADLIERLRSARKQNAALDADADPSRCREIHAEAGKRCIHSRAHTGRHAYYDGRFVFWRAVASSSQETPE